MKELLDQLTKTHTEMVESSVRLLKAGHPDKCKEMSGAATILFDWIKAIRGSDA